MRTALILALCLGLAACGPDAPPIPAPIASSWQISELLEVTEKIGGVAIGDVDARFPGNEIVAVTGGGEVWVLAKSGETWRSERAADLPGEMIQVAIGDADPTRPGLEIVAVGMARGTEEDGGLGAAWILAQGGEGWTHELLCENEELIHGVAILPGTVVVVGFNNQATRLRKLDGVWAAHSLTQLEAPGKNAIPYGQTVIVGCANGTVLQIDDLESGASHALARGEAGQSRLGTDGERIVAAGDDGRLSLVAEGTLNVIYSESAKLRGAVLAELDRESAGLEAATAGYSGRVTVLRQGAGTWEAEVALEAKERLHHLAAGELDARGPGLELVTCGYSRKVLLLVRAPSR